MSQPTIHGIDRNVIYRRAARNILGFIMLKVFIAVFLQKTTRSLEKRAKH